MATVASAESLPISVLPDLIVSRERVIFGRRTCHDGCFVSGYFPREAAVSQVIERLITVTSMGSLPTSSCSGFYSHAPEVPLVLLESVIGR